MPIDSNIALGVKPIQLESPLNQLGQALQLQGVQQGNQLNRLKMDEYDRGVARQNQLRTLLGGLGDVPDEKRVSALRTGGYFDEADKLETGLLARQKTGAEVTKLGAEAKAKEFEGLTKKLEVAGSTFGFVMKNPTLENAMQALDYLGTNGIYTPEQVNQYKTQIQQNPASIGQLAEIAFRSVLSAKDQLGKADTVNAGNRQVTQVVDPVTGKVQVSGEMPILESEAQRLKREQDAAEAARGRAVTMRGQDMTDRRVRESNEIARDKKTAAGVKLSPTEQKELFEADDTVQSGVGAISSLKKALELNNKAYSGVGAGARATIMSNLPGQSEAADATIALDNIIMDQALSQMKAIFGGNPTEGERAILLDLQASASKTPTQRKAILDRAIASTQRRVEFSKKKADDLRTGKYMQPGGGPSATQDAGMNPQDAQALQWANANPNDARAAQIKQRLGQ